MRDDINLLNLMNGMHYSIHQLAHLAEYARRASEDRGGEGYDLEAAVRYRTLLVEIVSALERGGEPTKETLRKAAKLRSQVCEKRKAKPKRVDGEGLGTLVASAREILFPAQREVLADYNPCLIPPKNLKDPVRVGQAHDSGPAVRALEGLRSIAEERWRQRRGEIVERTLARIEEHGGKFPEAERESKAQALGELLERARGLSALDFELQKEDLAKELEPFDRKESLKKELESIVDEDVVLNQKIRAFLLHGRAAALYETRLKQIREASIGQPVDLDKISAADSCRHGGCAIKDK